MIVRKGSEREVKNKLNNYRITRDSMIARECRERKYFEAKKERAEKNKSALLFYIETLKQEFSPQEFEGLVPVFDGWKKKNYAREAVLAHNDIRRELVRLVPKDELEEKLGTCQEKLKVHIEKLTNK